MNNLTKSHYTMAKKCTNDLQKLIKTCWSDFKDLERKHPNLVVNNSIPILWFGDLDSYFESERRIVTVALNPSNKEFMDKGLVGVEVRFPIAKTIVNKGILDNNDCDTYKRAMCEYFRTNRLSWFCSFERILNKLDSSYGGVFNPDAINTAIHIDIYSPVATTDKWSDLCQKGNDKTIINANSIPFTKLLSFLNPDVILISCNKNEISKLIDGKGTLIWSKPPKRFNEFINLYKFDTNKALISGLNMQGSPFGGYKDFYEQGFAEMLSLHDIFNL